MCVLEKLVMALDDGVKSPYFVGLLGRANKKQKIMAKDYQGLTMCPTLCQVYVNVLELFQSCD